MSFRGLKGVYVRLRGLRGHHGDRHAWTPFHSPRRRT